jgi:hypothetical protein
MDPNDDRKFDWDLLMFLNYSVRANYETYVVPLPDLERLYSEIVEECRRIDIDMSNVPTPPEMMARHPAISCLANNETNDDYRIVQAKWAETVESSAVVSLNRQYGAALATVLVNKACNEEALLRSTDTSLNTIDAFRNAIQNNRRRMRDAHRPNTMKFSSS